MQYNTTQESEKSIMEKLTPQGKMFALGYLLIITSMLVAMIYYKAYSAFSVVSIITSIIGFVLSVYVINCSVVGQCYLFAWIMAYAIIILAVVYALTIVFAISKN